MCRGGEAQQYVYSLLRFLIRHTVFVLVSFSRLDEHRFGHVPIFLVFSGDDHVNVCNEFDYWG